MQTRSCILFIFFALATIAQAGVGGGIPKGSIKGRVLDRETQAPLPAVNVSIIGTDFGDATDLDGRFVIEAIPVGSYSLRFSYIGYATAIKPDVIVRSNRQTFVETELKISALELEPVVVSNGYFSTSNHQPVNVANFTAEEIRRAPGSAGDVSRIIMGLPSLAKVNDQSNGLLVRGGSPLENGFYIDNIEIPDINHFPTQASSGGPIGLVNVDFIREVDFYTGAFSPAYGDRLSSVMSLSFREGNRDAFDGQLDLNFAGFGAVAEGPLWTKGSWLFSLRRSYLDLLVNVIDVGTTVAPRFGDMQWKIVYDLGPGHNLQWIGVWGDDLNENDQATAEENAMLVFGKQNITERTTGINWRALWGGSGYSNTSVSYSATRFKEDLHETGSAELLVRNRSLESSIRLRNVNHLLLSKNHSIEFGFEASHVVADYDNLYAPYTDAHGEPVPGLEVQEKITSQKFGGFANYEVSPLSRLTATLGVRADHFTYDRETTFSPRLGIAFNLSAETTLKAAFGIHRQSLPMLLLAQNRGRQLEQPRALHAVLGLSHLLADDIRLTLEIYNKRYNGFPIDPREPGLFLVDELFYRYGFFFQHEQLVSTGEAMAQGIEAMLQKKLTNNFYGTVSAACFRARYKGVDDVWRHRVFDNRLLFNLEGGYKPNSQWEFSLRWLYAGGVPYTPFDLEASAELNRAVLDENSINKARQPAYHSLNARFDRRFHFSGSTLVFYLSVWNLYSRKNVAATYWNQKENKPGKIHQWTFLPIFGLEYEF